MNTERLIKWYPPWFVIWGLVLIAVNYFFSFYFNWIVLTLIILFLIKDIVDIVKIKASSLGPYFEHCPFSILVVILFFIYGPNLIAIITMILALIDALIDFAEDVEEI